MLLFFSHWVWTTSLTLCNPMNFRTPGFPVLHYLSEFTQAYVHWVGDAIKPSHPLSPLSPTALTISQHRVLFQWVSSSHQVANVLELQLQQLIPFRIDWLDLGMSKGILKSLLQHHSLKATILWCSTFLMVQLSHLHMTIGKTIALTSWTFISKVMYFLFNMLSGCVIIFFPRSKYLLAMCVSFSCATKRCS